MSIMNGASHWCHIRKSEETKKKELIDKVWKWLEENQAHIVSETGVWLMWTAFEKDFRKAMED